jgi:putative membrane protein
MPQPNTPEPVPPSASHPSEKPNPHTSDHLANERTFLAWVRTSISVLGLGFVVAKFSVWLHELSARLGEPVRGSHSGMSLPLGVAMMAIGAFLAIVAAWRFRRVRDAIIRGQPSTGDHTVTIVAMLVLAMAAALIAYMLVTR